MLAGSGAKVLSLTHTQHLHTHTPTHTHTYTYTHTDTILSLSHTQTLSLSRTLSLSLSLTHTHTHTYTHTKGSMSSTNYGDSSFLAFGAPNDGLVYVVRLDVDDTCHHVTALRQPDSLDGDRFGSAVTLGINGMVWVGAPGYSRWTNRCPGLDCLDGVVFAHALCWSPSQACTLCSLRDICMLTYVCKYVCIYICMCVYMHICMDVCMYAYVCMYVCMYIRIYVCTYMLRRP
jgi:hypothetical protein